MKVLREEFDNIRLRDDSDVAIVDDRNTMSAAFEKVVDKEANTFFRVNWSERVSLGAI